MYAVENWYETENQFKVSEQEIGSALTGIKLRATVLITARMKRNLNKTRDKIERKKTANYDKPEKKKT